MTAQRLSRPLIEEIPKNNYDISPRAAPTLPRGKASPGRQYKRECSGSDCFDFADMSEAEFLVPAFGRPATTPYVGYRTYRRGK